MTTKQEKLLKKIDKTIDLMLKAQDSLLELSQLCKKFRNDEEKSLIHEIDELTNFDIEDTAYEMTLTARVLRENWR